MVGADPIVMLPLCPAIRVHMSDELQDRKFSDTVFADKSERFARALGIYRWTIFRLLPTRLKYSPYILPHYSLTRQPRKIKILLRDPDGESVTECPEQGTHGDRLLGGLDSSNVPPDRGRVLSSAANFTEIKAIRFAPSVRPARA